MTQRKKGVLNNSNKMVYLLGRSTPYRHTGVLNVAIRLLNERPGHVARHALVGFLG